MVTEEWREKREDGPLSLEEGHVKGIVERRRKIVGWPSKGALSCPESQEKPKRSRETRGVQSPKKRGFPPRGKRQKVDLNRKRFEFPFPFLSLLDSLFFFLLLAGREMVSLWLVGKGSFRERKGVRFKL
jgi:hypothetical protein